MTAVLVLDIDGVLIETRGYQMALQDTVSHFSRAMGLGDLPPTAEDLRSFEAYGMSSEWDMGAACVALLLTDRVLIAHEPGLPDGWDRALDYLGSRPQEIDKPDYAGLASAAGQALGQELPPSEAVLQTLISRLARCARVPDSLPGLLESLLGDVHSFYQAPVTRVFQHLTIGSERVEEIYGVPPELQSRPYLQLYDRPLLSAEMRECLLASTQSGWRAALCTLRPSLGPPLQPNLVQLGAPEAEMAREMVGLEALPAIGQGHMLWLSKQVEEPVERLVKPFPVQALSSIAAAMAGDGTEAMWAAYRLSRDGQLSGPFSERTGWDLYVVEDTPNGLAAFERAAGSLRSAGSNVRLHRWGVAGGSAAKSRALEAAGATVVQNVNQALLTILAGECPAGEV